jgi:hypothetical protein
MEPKVTFRIIRRCNFDCPGCCTFSRIDRKGDVRLGDFKQAIDILDDCGFQGILNISGGETTLHQDLPTMISYASSRLNLARIALFTNGDWIGRRDWEEKLAALFAGPNVLIRVSLDRQHTEGKLRGSGIIPDEQQVEKEESARFEKAGLFLKVMTGLGAVPGINFDFAFKGDIRQASVYMSDYGEVPVYLIKFREDPENRPREYGFLAIDVQENDDLLVYPTLGHIPLNKPLGGLESLASALEMNRSAMIEKEKIIEQQQWIKTYRD